MRNHLSFIMDYLDFPTEAQKELLAAYDVICANPKSEAILTKWVNTYEENIHLPYETAIREMEEAVSPAVLSMTGSLNESSDRFPGIPAVHPYTADLLLFLCLTRRLKALYDARGLSEQIYRDSCLDLTWKLNECHKMYGIWGTFVPWWEPGFYEMTRFALGRLQFELVPFPESYEASGKHKPDTMTQAINVHIPSCSRCGWKNAMLPTGQRRLSLPMPSPGRKWPLPATPGCCFRPTENSCSRIPAWFAL